LSGEYKEISFRNFHIATIANFISCKILERNPDFISISGSAYWDEGDRVIRWSDHWGVVASCYWQLWILNNESLCGECLYVDFRVKNV
jgi:hypothetical protein